MNRKRNLRKKIRPRRAIRKSHISKRKALIGTEKVDSILSESLNGYVELKPFPCVKSQLPILINAANRGSRAARCVLLHRITLFNLHGAVLPNILRNHLSGLLLNTINTTGEDGLGLTRTKRGAPKKNLSLKYKAFVMYHKKRSEGKSGEDSADEVRSILNLKDGATVVNYIYRRFRTLGKEAKEYDERLQSGVDALNDMEDGSLQALSVYIKSRGILLDDPVLFCCRMGVEWDLEEKESEALDRALIEDRSEMEKDWPIISERIQMGGESFAVTPFI